MSVGPPAPSLTSSPPASHTGWHFVSFLPGHSGFKQSVEDPCLSQRPSHPLLQIRIYTEKRKMHSRKIEREGEGWPFHHQGRIAASRLCCLSYVGNKPSLTRSRSSLSSLADNDWVCDVPAWRHLGREASQFLGRWKASSTPTSL
jgi:hypothetical protein